jgi:hypothetical protein
LFDGALPTSKKDERVLRLQQNIKRVTNFRVNFPTTACPIPVQLSSAAYSFLAPSLMEALRASDFAHATRIVPGEADDWCACYANDNTRAVVFTSDTDLLLYEYPRESLVIFFKDVSFSPDPDFKAYSPTSLSQRWNLSSLIPLAYATVQEPWKGIGENVELAQSYSLESDVYLDFSKRYTTKAQNPSCTSTRSEVQVALQRLDVRVSEFVHQALDDPFIPIVYLPFLLEDPNQASAWNIGQDLRILAYSLLSPSRVVVQECKRKAQSVTISDHSLYPLDQVQATAKDLVDTINAWMLWTASIKLPQDLIWPLFAVSLVLPHVSLPPQISLLVRVVNGDFNNTWEFVHLNARIHAAIYLLRILQQCVSVWLAINYERTDEDLHKTILRLSQSLEGLPTIAEMIIVPGQPIKEPIADDETLRQALSNIYMAAGIDIPDEHSSKKQRKKARKAKEKEEKITRPQQEAAKKSIGPVFNVFDILNKKSN